jgi:hypothetical protein
VLVIHKCLGLDLKNTTGGAGLKRCNRSKGFSAKSARHTKEQENYIFLQGLDCKILSSSIAAAWELVAGQNCSDLDLGRAQEVGEMKEEREGVRFHALPAAEIHCRDRISRRKMALAALFMGGCSVRFLILLVVSPGHQGVGQGRRTREGRALK